MQLIPATVNLYFVLVDICPYSDVPVVVDQGIK